MRLASLVFVVALLVFQSGVKGLSFNNFFGYPFGTDQGDVEFTDNQDDFLTDSMIATLPTPYPFFCHSYNFANINNNGYISFLKKGVSIITPYSAEPFPISGQFVWSPLVAAFWADVDVTSAGRVYWRLVTLDTNEALLNNITTYTLAKLPLLGTFYAMWALIVTWDGVGYYAAHSDKTNSFQLVVATDGGKSVAILNYAENGITWTTGDSNRGVNGLGGNPAAAGYNVGDGDGFFLLPGSLSDEIINISRVVGNTGLKGQWIFRTDAVDVSSCPLDEEEVKECPSNPCLNDGDCKLRLGKLVCHCTPCRFGEFCDLAEVSLSPSAGSQLGGTPVIIELLPKPCLLQSYQPVCIFNGGPVRGVYLNDSHILCAAPGARKAGSVEFILQLYVNSSLLYTAESSFLYIPHEHYTDVEIIKDSLLLVPGEELKIRWKPVILPNANFGFRTYTIDIDIFKYDFNHSRFVQAYTLQSAAPNVGLASLLIPDLSDSHLVVPVVLRVSIRSTNVKLKDLFALWSGVAFLYTGKSDVSSELRGACLNWMDKNIRPVHVDVQSCPPTSVIAELPGSGFLERHHPIFMDAVYFNQSKAFFHSGTSICYKRASTPQQECCYDNKGRILTEPPGGGWVSISPVDNVHIVSWKERSAHYLNDIIPYIYCCKGNLASCGTFFDSHSFQNEKSRITQGYIFPTLPGVVYGDPHLITMDGHRYTFNGRGEFVLAESNDGSFQLQGQLGTYRDGVDATVLLAVAVRTTESENIVFRATTDGIITSVREKRVNFGAIQEQDFDGVTLVNKQNKKEIKAFFFNGAYIEVRHDKGFISALLVSLPEGFAGRLQGLLGNYNGNTEDDFVPFGSNESLPFNTTSKNIHYQFGLTWMVTGIFKSLFGHKSSEILDRINIPSFDPILSPNVSFLNESRAVEQCDNSSACIFDTAATGEIEMGMISLKLERELGIYNTLAKVRCDPECGHGICVPDGVCVCTDGYTGAACNIAPVALRCDINPCKNGGKCSRYQGSYTCACRLKYTGLNCQREADIAGLCGCQNGGTCSVKSNQLVCQCPAGFNGTLCERIIVTLAPAPAITTTEASYQITYIIVGCLVGAFVLVIILLVVGTLLALVIRRKKKRMYARAKLASSITNPSCVVLETNPERAQPLLEIVPGRSRREEGPLITIRARSINLDRRSERSDAKILSQVSMELKEKVSSTSNEEIHTAEYGEYVASQSSSSSEESAC